MKINLTLGAIFGVISQIAPFLLPALFVESGLFAVLAPLPVFLLTLRHKALIGLLAVFTNSAFLFALQGAQGALLGVWILGTVGVLFPFFILKKIKPYTGFAITYLVGMSMMAGSLLAISYQDKQNPADWVKSKITATIEELSLLPNSPIQKLIQEQGKTEVIEQINLEFPSALILSLLAILWMNTLFASRLTRGIFDDTFWTHYRTPEWWVWPTLLCGAGYAFSHHAIYYFSLNILKLMLAAYVLQGLSIISFLLNRYSIKGLGRGLIFALLIFIALPLVLSVGFFDQWFDFRRKFGQSL